MLENNGYTIKCKNQMVLCDIFNNDCRINWFNFNKGDNYYTSNGIGYPIIYVNHNTKIVAISYTEEP